MIINVEVNAAYWLLTPEDMPLPIFNTVSIACPVFWSIVGTRKNLEECLEFARLVASKGDV